MLSIFHAGESFKRPEPTHDCKSDKNRAFSHGISLFERRFYCRTFLCWKRLHFVPFFSSSLLREGHGSSDTCRSSWKTFLSSLTRGSNLNAVLRFADNGCKTRSSGHPSFGENAWILHPSLRTFLREGTSFLPLPHCHQAARGGGIPLLHFLQDAQNVVHVVLNQFVEKNVLANETQKGIKWVKNDMHIWKSSNFRYA